jgi:hypothetical protein
MAGVGVPLYYGEHTELSRAVLFTFNLRLSMLCPHPDYSIRYIHAEKKVN